MENSQDISIFSKGISVISMVNYYKEAVNEKVVKKIQELSFKTKDNLPKEYNKIRDGLLLELIVT